MTDFKIGYAPLDVLEFYCAYKASWFGVRYHWDHPSIVLNGLSALGLTYYFKPEPASFFITGGLGLSNWSRPFESDTQTLTGFGWFAGAGYEFSGHMNIALDLIWGEPSRTRNGIKSEYNTFSVKLTVSAIRY